MGRLQFIQRIQNIGHRQRNFGVNYQNYGARVHSIQVEYPEESLIHIYKKAGKPLDPCKAIT